MKVNRETSDFERQTWTFRMVSFPIAVLFEYQVEQRATRRHKWRVGNCWDRLRTRSSTIKSADVPLPIDVHDEALRRFRESVSVGDIS